MWLKKHDDNGNPKGVYKDIKFSDIKKKIAPTFKELIKYLKDRPPTPMKDENNDNIFTIVTNFFSNKVSSLFKEDTLEDTLYEQPLELLHLKKIVKTVFDLANAPATFDLVKLAEEAQKEANFDLAKLAEKVRKAPSPVVDSANVAEEAKKLLLQDKDIISEMREKIALLITNDKGKEYLRTYFKTDPYAYATLCASWFIQK